LSTGETAGTVKDQALGLVTRVRYMLEYMTLCADPTLFQSPSAPQPYPVPNGIPMGIVCLPDFVVDVAVDGIKKATATRRGQPQPFDVGGRAGRLAWALHNFGGQQNGWYSVKYIAKAGDVGRVVLRRRFSQPSGQIPFEPTSLRYIVPSRADRDWLHVYGKELVEPVESSHEGLEVSAADVDESPHYSLADLFVDARYVVISSKHATHAISALDLVAEGLERLSGRFRDSKVTIIPIGVLVDLSALASQGDVRRVVDSFGKLKKRAFAFAIESTALCDRQIDFDKKPFDHILMRQEQGVRSGNQFESLPKLANRPVAREAFTAGYVLASSCALGWKLLRRWHQYFPTMRPIDGRPHIAFPTSEQAEPPGEEASPSCTMLPSLAFDAPDAFSSDERLRFAAALARHTDSTPLSYRDLIRSVAKVGAPSFNEIERGEIEFAKTLNDDLGTKLDMLEVKSALTDCLVRRFVDETASSTLSLHLPPSDLEVFASSCQLRDARQATEVDKKSIDKAVMFDLDATLFDSGGMLRACWFNGLRAFFGEAGISIESREIHTVIDIYKIYIYENHKRFSKLLRDHPDIPPEWQPCDFRQIWNHRYAWATLLWILKPDPLHSSHWEDERWRSILIAHRKQTSTDRPGVRCTCIICERLKRLLAEEKADLPKRRELTLPLRDQLIRFKFAIQSGRKAFWEVDYPSFPQARSCVKTIRALPGCEVYVVTEGHEETQLKKLKCAGLSDLFPRNRVLSTGAASAAEQSANDLTRLKQSHERTKGELQKAYDKVRDDEAKRSLKPLLEKLEATIESISFLRDLLSVLYEKRHTRFYSAVIDAIRRKPESPAQLLLAFVGRRDLTLQQELGGGTPMKFFMIGDRYDNDCRPLLELPLSNGAKVGVGTCRLLSGKRAKDDCPPKPKPDPTNPAKKSPPPPPTMLVCDTLAQVAHILHHTSTWEKIALLEEVTPPVLLDSKEHEEIYYGPIGAAADGADPTLKALAPKFKDMSWARADEILKDERSVHDMLNQIEKDLEVCEVENLSQLFKSVGLDMDNWWQKPDTGGSGPEPTLLKGALKILANVNWWRHMLGRPLLKEPGDPSETLEWVLGSYLLRILYNNSLSTKYGELSWASDTKLLEGFRASDVLEAIPFSYAGIAIVQALEEEVRAQQEFRREIIGWLGKAWSLDKKTEPKG